MNLNKTQQFDHIICKLTKILSAADVILLFGPMAAGKTFFTAKLCQAMKINEHPASPTYTLTNEYYSKEKNLHILHSDLYRIKQMDDFIMEEIFHEEKISIIEWAEKIPKEMLSKQFLNRLHIHINAQHEIIKLEKYGKFATFSYE